MTKRPIEADYTSHVAYTRALEAYCDSLEQPAFATRTAVEPYGWHVTGCNELLRGEYAQSDAELAAKRCGGTAKAVAVYTAPQAQQPDARTAAIKECIDRLVKGGKPAEAQMLRHHFGVEP